MAEDYARTPACLRNAGSPLRDGVAKNATSPLNGSTAPRRARAGAAYGALAARRRRTCRALAPRVMRGASAGNHQLICGVPPASPCLSMARHIAHRSIDLAARTRGAQCLTGMVPSLLGGGRATQRNLHWHVAQ